MERERYESIYWYLRNREHFMNLVRIYRGTRYTEFYRNSHVTFNNKRRCFLSRNMKTKITYSGSFCCLSICVLKNGTCKDCFFNEEL